MNIDNTNKYILLDKLFGVFSYSQKAVDEYNKRKTLIDETFVPIRCQCPDDKDISRYDELMIDIVREFGEDASGKWSKLEIVPIPTEYYDCIEISHNDVEDIYINYEKYKLYKIHQTLYSFIPDYEKVFRIKCILDADFSSISLN
jgi:hypothetical protein